MIKQLDIDIDYKLLLKTIYELNLIELISPKVGNQLAVHCREETALHAQLSEGCNSLFFDWDAYDSTIHDKVPKRSVQLKEIDFNKICDLFKNTYIETVVNLLHNQFEVYRGRFMYMRYKTCLSSHKDDSYRIHIPLITNPNCFMVINDVIYKMNENATYITNTTLEHTAVNAGITDRLHLVFCTDSKI
jgi:hypothetical protein